MKGIVDQGFLRSFWKFQSNFEHVLFSSPELKLKWAFLIAHCPTSVCLLSFNIFDFLLQNSLAYLSCYWLNINMSLWECKSAHGKGKELLNKKMWYAKTYFTNISVQNTMKCLICWALVK
jgi:hypothetical protein